MEFVGDVATAIMTPLYYAMSGLLLVWHWLASFSSSSDSGWTWAIAIVATTITVRILGMPLSVKQFQASQAMQALQPRIQELQEQFAGDRERLTQEQKKLWKESGTNPFASCLPLVLALPVFFALFRVIELPLSFGEEGARGFMTQGDVASMYSAEVLGTTLADNFIDSSHGSTKILALVFMLVTATAQFVAQRQTITHTPPGAMDGPYAQQQKFLLYTLPVVFAVSGFYFPLGVVLFWTTWYLWTWGEHSFLLSRGTPPGHSPN